MLVHTVAPILGAGVSVRLGTECGDVVGTWRGSQPVPQDVARYVELDTRRAYDWATEIAPAPGAKPEFTVESAERVAVIGVVTDVDENNVLTLSIGGNLLTLETEGDLPPGLTGASVRVVVDDLEFYPYTL